MINIRADFTHLIIIGNGFDLNQKLKTSYPDFIKSEQFKNLLDKGNCFVDYLNTKHQLQNWIDIENELKTYSNNLNNTDADNNFHEEFITIANSLKEYLATISYSKLEESEYSYKLIDSIKDKDFLILDFNYTKTAETILIKLGINEADIKERIIKVHGSLDSEIIFGVEDRADIKQNHVFLRKAYNKNFTGTDFIDRRENCKNIYFFGHSLGETDHMYFESFFQTYPSSRNKYKDKNIVLYHYGNEGYDQIFQQIDKLTSRQLSRFRQQNDIEFIDTSK